MGNQRQYLKSGGFSEYLYQQVGETIIADGVIGKIIKMTEHNNYHDGLPEYSNKSNIYLKFKNKTTNIEQIRIYKNRRAYIDFDWGHTHKVFKKGTVHVHEWFMNDKGEWTRSKNPRYLSDEEISRYGKLFSMKVPNVKLR